MMRERAEGSPCRVLCPQPLEGMRLPASLTHPAHQPGDLLMPQPAPLGLNHPELPRLGEGKASPGSEQAGKRQRDQGRHGMMLGLARL